MKSLSRLDRNESRHKHLRWQVNLANQFSFESWLGALVVLTAPKRGKNARFGRTSWTEARRADVACYDVRCWLEAVGYRRFSNDDVRLTAICCATSCGCRVSLKAFA